MDNYTRNRAGDPKSEGLFAAGKRSKSQATDAGAEEFNPHAPGLQRTWSSYAELVCCINSYPNGVTISFHDKTSQSGQGSESNSDSLDNREVKHEQPLSTQFNLRLKDTRDYQIPKGRFFLYKENYRQGLERHFSRLHSKGVLSSTVVYFGTTADPFAAYHRRFDVTSACLQLFERYKPGRVVVQTRSPLVIAGLPTLRYLDSQAAVVIPIETHLEKSVARYAPGQPKISERLVAAQGLRRQGVSVNLCVCPILPYGDFYRDAWDFAELLDRYADYITMGCLASGLEADERQLKGLPLARKLAADKQFAILRPHAHRALYRACSVVAPEKLMLPVSAPTKPSQMTLFAA